jgi:hypothetical protein
VDKSNHYSLSAPQIVYKRKVKLECHNLENLWVELLTFQGKLLCTVYRPPNDNEFWVNLDENIDTVKAAAAYGAHELFLDCSSSTSDVLSQPKPSVTASPHPLSDTQLNASHQPQ